MARRVTAAQQRHLERMTGSVRASFARQIKEKREALGLSQEAFGKLVGKDQGYISLVERGIKYNLRIDTMVEIAEAIGMDLTITLTPKMPPT